MDSTDSNKDFVDSSELDDTLKIQTKPLKKRVSIQSENLKIKKPSSLQLKQQNFSTPQLIDNINEQVNEVLKNQGTSLNLNNPDNKSNEIATKVPDKLISELSTLALEIMNNKNNEVKETKDLLIYTKAMELPSKLETLMESRVIIRILQLICAIGAFASLSVSSLDVNYNSSIIADSGINTMCLVSLSSTMVSIATLFVYFNPKLLNVSPQRHFRSSRVEVCVDLLYLAFWIFSSIEITIYGRCPRTFFDVNASSEKKCYSWNFCMSFGYVEVIIYLVSLIRGVYDLKTHDWGRRNTQKYTGKGVHLWVRGNWKEEINQE